MIVANGWRKFNQTKMRELPKVGKMPIAGDGNRLALQQRNQLEDPDPQAGTQAESPNNSAPEMDARRNSFVRDLRELDVCRSDVPLYSQRSYGWHTLILHHFI